MFIFIEKVIFDKQVMPNTLCWIGRVRNILPQNFLSDIQGIFELLNNRFRNRYCSKNSFHTCFMTDSVLRDTLNVEF